MAADNKEYVTALSTDMSKAFDSLHPALMIQKLKAYGFSEASQNLMRSFLERRRNRVKLQEAHSAWKERKRGCPQGSSFGPLLWNLFQNDLSLHRQSANLFMYADDHQIYTSDSDMLKSTQTLRRQRQCHNGTRRTYCKPTLRNTRSLLLIHNLPRKALGMNWQWNSMDMKANHLIISKFLA